MKEKGDKILLDHLFTMMRKEKFYLNKNNDFFSLVIIVWHVRRLYDAKIGSHETRYK